MSWDEIKKALDEQNAAFEEFKATNDKRLVALEKGEGIADFEAKLANLEKTISDLGKQIDAAEKEMRRPGTVAGEDEQARFGREHKGAFLSWMRNGKNSDALMEMDRKRFGAINTISPDDGGFAVPEQLDRDILTLLRNESPMREVCRVITVGSSEYKKLVNIHGTASGWVGEEGERPATDTSQLKQITPHMGEIYAYPQATQTSLDDIFFDVEAWLNGEIVLEFSEKEGAAFVTGDGVNKPKGFLGYTAVATADATRAYGSLEYIATAVADGFKAVNASTGTGPADTLIDALYKLKKGYRRNGRWMLNSNTLAAVRKWKDADGRYVWSPSVEAGQPALLLGYATVDNEDMPDIGAGTVPIAIGDWQRGYYIVDRMGVRMLRDPFTNKPYVGFYTTKRVGGMLVDSQAIKLVKCSAS